jgi:hypothetical protein
MELLEFNGNEFIPKILIEDKCIFSFGQYFPIIDPLDLPLRKTNEHLLLVPDSRCRA